MTARIQRDDPVVSRQAAGYIVPGGSAETVGVQQQDECLTAAPLEAADFQRPAAGAIRHNPGARPRFAVLGSRLTHVGSTGAGQVAKAANQVIVGLNIGAVAEAFALAESAGVDPARVREALMGGFASSRILEVHGQRMIERSYAPGGRITTQHKDLSQALELAGRHGQSLPATALNRDLYARLIEQGDGDLDHSALIRAIRPGR